jgi:hypothetical protein
MVWYSATTAINPASFDLINLSIIHQARFMLFKLIITQTVCGYSFQILFNTFPKPY